MSMLHTIGATRNIACIMNISYLGLPDSVSAGVRSSKNSPMCQQLASSLTAGAVRRRDGRSVPRGRQPGGTRSFTNMQRMHGSHQRDTEDGEIRD